VLPVSSCEAERRTFQFAPETEKVPAQYDGTEQINSVAVLHVLLGLAIFFVRCICGAMCFVFGHYIVLCFPCKIVRLSHSFIKGLDLT